MKSALVEARLILRGVVLSPDHSRGLDAEIRRPPAQAEAMGGATPGSYAIKAQTRRCVRREA